MTQDKNGPPKSIALPYSEILTKLIKSVMHAQLDFVQEIERSGSVNDGAASISNEKIHEHFKWMVANDENKTISDRAGATFGKEGLDRHIFDAPDQDWQIIAGLRETIGKKKRGKATRVSSIIRRSFDECEFTKGQGDKSNSIKICSPLRVVLDILSDPEAPGAHAYPLLTLRSFIFETFKSLPEMFLASDAAINDTSTTPQKKGTYQTFSVDDVTEALGKVWTSFRPRVDSLGKDPISQRGRGDVDTVVRAWLALKGMALLFFTDSANCKKFLKGGEIFIQEKGIYPFELQKVSWLNKLPDPGVIINELWGLPVPIRGADILFRGGLRFPESGGLIVAVHGEPGAGKTSIALAIGAHLVPFGIKTLFITADGKEEDLRAKVAQLVPNRVRRLSFFPDDRMLKEYMHFSEIEAEKLVVGGTAEKLSRELNDLSKIVNQPIDANSAAPLPCHGMVVMDGLHDLFAEGEDASLHPLYDLVASCRSLNMLVILTSGGEWERNTRLDYLVDVSMRISQENINDYGAKPDRSLTLTKTRHQLSALGKHGFRLDGHKGVRFSPPINYGLDLRSIVAAKLPDDARTLTALSKALELKHQHHVSPISEPLGGNIKKVYFYNLQSFVEIYPGSHVFINGRGSSGKAGLALKIAFSPALMGGEQTPKLRGPISNVLVVSFLYSDEYYRNLIKRIVELQRWEIASGNVQAKMSEKELSDLEKVRLKVIHLYPGHLRPNDLFNKIEWELDIGRLNGTPYTAVVIDGLHNVPIQFPELEKHGLLWPQLYKSLRTRDITVVTTHTTLVIPDADDPTKIISVDDRLSEPLRHALVHKTDFQLEIDPLQSKDDPELFDDPQIEDLFCVRILSAIGQPISDQTVLWSRNQLVLFKDPRSKYLGSLAF